MRTLGRETGCGWDGWEGLRHKVASWFGRGRILAASSPANAVTTAASSALPAKLASTPGSMTSSPPQSDLLPTITIHAQLISDDGCGDVLQYRRA